MSEITIFEEKHNFYKMATTISDFLSLVNGEDKEKQIGEAILEESLKGLIDCGISFETEQIKNGTRTTLQINDRIFTFDTRNLERKQKFYLSSAFMDEVEVIVYRGNEKEAVLHFIVIPFDWESGKQNSRSCPIFFLVENNGQCKYFTATKSNLIEFSAFGYSFEIEGGFWDGDYVTEIAIMNAGLDLEVSVAEYRPAELKEGHIILNSGRKTIHVMPIPAYFDYNTPAAIVCIDTNGNRKVFCTQEPGASIEVFLSGEDRLIIDGAFQQEDLYEYSVKEYSKADKE